MLSKLIKHEFRATRRIMLPLLASIVVLSIMAGFSTRILDNPNSPDFANTVGFIVLALYFVAMFSAGVVAFVLMIERFEKNLLGDEGYLMFTLPVSVDRQIFAKLIVSVVWFACAALISLTLGFMLVAADGQGVLEMFKGLQSLGDAIRKGFETLGNGSAGVGIIHVVGYAVEFIVLVAVFTASFCLHFYAAMAIGYSFNDHKRLLSVVAFFAIEIILNAIGGIITYFSGRFIGGVFEAFESWFSSGANFASGMHLGLLGGIVYGLILSAVYYLPTRYFLKNKLNLA